MEHWAEWRCFWRLFIQWLVLICGMNTSTYWKKNRVFPNNGEELAESIKKKCTHARAHTHSLPLSNHVQSLEQKQEALWYWQLSLRLFIQWSLQCITIYNCAHQSTPLMECIHLCSSCSFSLRGNLSPIVAKEICSISKLKCTTGGYDFLVDSWEDPCPFFHLKRTYFDLFFKQWKNVHRVGGKVQIQNIIGPSC